MAKADSKELYIPLSTIYGKPNPDGTYTLTALDIKNLNDNLYAIAKKIQGGLTFADMTKEVNQEYTNMAGDITQVRVTAEGAAVTASAADGKATNAQITANGASVTASDALGKAQSVELTVDGFTVTGPGGVTTIDGNKIKSGTIEGVTLVSRDAGSTETEVSSGEVRVKLPNSYVNLMRIGLIDGKPTIFAPYPGYPLKLYSAGNSAIDSGAGYTLYLGSTGGGGDVKIGKPGANITIEGNVTVNGTPI